MRLTQAELVEAGFDKLSLRNSYLGGESGNHFNLRGEDSFLPTPRGL